MDRCPHCKSDMAHVKRNTLQFLLFSETNTCRGCGFGRGLYRPFLARLVLYHRFIFSRHTSCIRCGSTRVLRSDFAEKISKNPLGWVQRIAGAPLIECCICEQGYFDWRDPRPPREVVAASAAREMSPISR